MAAVTCRAERKGAIDFIATVGTPVDLESPHEIGLGVDGPCSIADILRQTLKPRPCTRSPARQEVRDESQPGPTIVLSRTA
jgi:hypothetical protein